MSWQTFQEVHLTLGCFVDLVQYTNSEEFKEKYPSATYMIPKRLNQDIHVVESWFSFQIGCCGDVREPTVLQYENNSTKLISVKQAQNDITKSSYGNATTGADDEMINT